MEEYRFNIRRASLQLVSTMFSNARRMAFRSVCSITVCKEMSSLATGIKVDGKRFVLIKKYEGRGKKMVLLFVEGEVGETDLPTVPSFVSVGVSP